MSRKHGPLREEGDGAEEDERRGLRRGGGGSPSFLLRCGELLHSSDLVEQL